MCRLGYGARCGVRESEVGVSEGVQGVDEMGRRGKVRTCRRRDASMCNHGCTEPQHVFSIDS